MSDIRHGSRKPIKTRLNKDFFYDFTLASYPYSLETPFNCDIKMGKGSSFLSLIQCRENMLNSNPCIIAHFDIGKDVDKTTLTSFSDLVSWKTWEKANNSETVVLNLGITGLDNKTIKTTVPIRDNTPENKETLEFILGYSSLYLGDEFVSNNSANNNVYIPSDNLNKFILRPVGGYTQKIDYTINIIKDPFLANFETTIGNSQVAELNGGFYQGFYKIDGVNYQTLPNRFKNGFTISTWLCHTPNLTQSNPNLTRLNDLRPKDEQEEDNYGFFLYFGTRAENKFWADYKTTNDVIFKTNINESEATIRKNDLITPLTEKEAKTRVIDNQFLIMGRANKNNTKDGLGIYNVYDFKGKDIKINVPEFKQKYIYQDNPFLLFGRSNGRETCTKLTDGYGQLTVCNLKEMENNLEVETPTNNPFNHANDIIDNAVGFRITKDGKLGYRYITVDQDGDIVLKQAYTENSIIPEDKWINISLRWIPEFYLDEDEDKCKEVKIRNGQLMVYVNCALEYVFNDFPEYIGKRLDESSEKQVGVPYNISWGGGTQGLLESVTYNGQDSTDLFLNLEKYFAGTFIGKISQLRIYDCNLSWCHIRQTCDIEGFRYGINAKEGYLAQENNKGVHDLLILLEDYNKIIIQ